MLGNSRWALVASVCVLLVACENVKSEDVDTDALYADLRVTATGDGASRVGAWLRVGGGLSNTYLDLSSGDSLTARQGESIKTLARQSNVLGEVWYEESFAIDAENTPFLISLTRASTDPSACGTGHDAPNSNVSLPAPFTLSAPTADASFSRAADDIPVAWAESGKPDPMTVHFSGGCIVGRSIAVSGDPGTATIPHSMIEPIRDHETESCRVTITVERRRAGALDPNYGEGGTISAAHVRSIDVLSTP